MTTSVPVWLLDVDGVINATRPAWGAATRTSHASADGHNWRIRWAPHLTARINQIATSGLADVRWCSTWCGQTSQLEAMFGLPAFPPAFIPGSERVEDQKTAAAWDVINSGRSLIWTDDEIPYHVADQITQTSMALIVRPNERRGLTPADMDAIDEWIGSR